jgi:N-acetylmuramoyl-L-alanine amidase
MTTLVQKDVRYIVIHYTATAVESDFSAADIDAMHKRRGWRGIGYHFYIRKNGSIEKGRPLRERGAHVKGHNHHSVGICYEGGVHASDPHTGLDTRTDAQKAAMVRVIRDMLDRYPGAQVVGHRDMPGAATQCPGFDAGAWWDAVNKPRDATPTKEPSGIVAAILAALRAIFGGKA